MIYLDSWIFLDYLASGLKYVKCKNIILSKQQKVISSVVLMEVKYKATKKRGKKNTNEFLRKILADQSIIVINVDARIAQRAANLRLKYYKKGKRELSYSDCIHLATAILSRCKRFYSGDPDFIGIEEIKTIIV